MDVAVKYAKKLYIFPGKLVIHFLMQTVFIEHQPKRYGQLFMFEKLTSRRTESFKTLRSFDR